MDENLNTLNDQQKSAAEAQKLPLLIVAGAGTGKTRTLTSRIIHFIMNGVPAEKICAITFTNKAAKEMTERVQNYKFPARGAFRPETHGQIQNSESLPFISTFHSLGARILRKEARLLGRKSNFTIFDDHDSFDLIKKIAKKLSPRSREEKESGALKKEARERPAFFARQISAIKSTSSFIGELKKGSHPKNVLALRALELYEKELENNNAFDFDDLIEKVVAVFGKYPEVLKKYQNKFDAVLVDEYQDLNPKQYELIKLLAGEHKNLTVVGDDEQMIYGWRNADMEIFTNFERDWPGAQIAFLEKNYRSTSNIIAAASEVAKNNSLRRSKNLWTKNPAGPLIKIFEALDENGEAEWIASQMESGIWNIEFGTGGGDGRKSHLPGFVIPNSKFKIQNSVAVLYRTNAQSRAIEQALIRRQIPYKIFGGLRFYERKEIKDIVAALRLTLNDKDELSRDRLEKLLSKSRFAELKEKINEAKNEKPAKVIDMFLKTADYFDYLERNFINHEERRENIAEFAVFAAGFKDLQELLEEIALVQATDDLAAGKAQGTGLPATAKPKNIAHLSTIHIAKGLEFDKVFIAGCSEGLLPHAMSLSENDKLEEERRLMYVAMTRAKTELAISFYGEPSRFISEMPQELLALENNSSAEILFQNDDEKYITLD